MPRCFDRKRRRYSSLDKFEDDFDSAIGLMLHCIILNAYRAVGCGIFSNLNKCRPEAADDVISGMTLDYVNTDVHASIGDYRLNSGRIIRLVAGPVLRTSVRI